MLNRELRLRAVQRLLGEIGESVDQGDRMAVLIGIHSCLRRGEITTRDAERLETMLSGLPGATTFGLAG